jgi:hypothetical protein
MAEQGPIATGEDRGHPPSFIAEGRVSHGVHPAVDPVKSASADAALDGVLAQPGSVELLDRDHAVLTGGQPGNPKVGCQHTVGALLAHIASKASPREFAPLA